MIDLRALEEDPDAFAANLRRRGEVGSLDELVRLTHARKAALREAQTAQETRNKLNDQMKKATPEEREQKRVELRSLGDRIKELEMTAKDTEERLNALALVVPNPPRPEVPQGKGSDDNVETQRVLEPRAFAFAPRDHVDVMERLGMLDTGRAAKISGARFAFLKGHGARLERALAAFMLDFHLARGDVEIAPPYLVSGKTLQGTGQLPKFGDDLFSVSFGPPKEAGPTPLYLIPTSEVPITNYYADEILDEETLPQRFCAFSPCFRAEAGSAGRDTRGLIRQHQFDKVEMVRFCTPAQALAELEAMVQRASDLMTALALPHRVMLLCTGDMGFGAEKTYDLEVWLPGQENADGTRGAYREISSCSTCGTFQARRAAIRFRPTPAPGTDPKKAPRPQPLVTLNGSGLAVGRTLIALVENHQQEDGSVAIPAALRPYLGGIDVLKA
ncbi:MAG: serine--tRNA ligase [Deltaproteobacteria bacterium]|nr:serine--tRNA ligase [Deltaproteobacteria bacterium]